MFRLAKPIALKFGSEPDFTRRRNVWFAATILGFLSPNFWIFALFAVPLYVWAGRKDTNPIAAYLLLLHVMPPVPIDIPSFGIGLFFSLDNYRLLSFCILIPTALRARRAPERDGENKSGATDWLLFAFGILNCILFVPPDMPNHVILHNSATNVVRTMFLFMVDVFALYYAISRTCSKRRKIEDAQAAFCVAAAIMAVIAAFEHFKGWLLYTQLAQRWNPADANYLMSWLVRGDSWLRAQASAGHALSLGFLLAIAFGFWLNLQTRVSRRSTRWAVGAIYWLGMISTFSRGPWIGAVLIYLAYSAIKPRAVSRLFRGALLAGALLGLISLTPMGEKLLDSLPFTHGHTDETFSYRQRLLDRSLELIQAQPLFGDQLAVQKMEDLRQGQGIIDIVNSYVGVALFSGLVGLTMFLGFVLTAAAGAFRAARRVSAAKPERALLGLNIVAVLFGIMFMIADTSLIFGVEKLFYILVAFAVGFARLPVAGLVSAGRAPARQGNV
jgi:O-antigen ligase